MKTETIVGLFLLGSICIFFYLSFTIGSMRLDRDRYYPYRAYFDDIGGLEKKDPVKIAGVQVGWVENIKLSKEGMAEITFLVHKQNRLAKNARAMIRQEGLLGNKFLEIDPGDSQTGILLPGGALGFPTPAPPTIGDVIYKFGDIASSIQAIATSLQSVIATQEGKENLKDALKGFAVASNRIAKVSELLEETLRKNEENINATLLDMRNVVSSLSKGVPQISDDFHAVATTLNSDTLPALSNGVTNIAGGVTNLSTKAGAASEAIEEASIYAKDGFREAGEVFEKINRGQGLVGKLITKDETYKDIKKTLHTLREFTSKLQSLDILIDMHSEYMIRTANNKGYFELRLRPFDDYFYLFQLVSDERGYIQRSETIRDRFDYNNTLLIAPEIADQYRFPPKIEKTKRIKNTILFSVQFGKTFDRLAFRIGVFENTFGFGVDFIVPVPTNKFHWITTVELFDGIGINRFNDRRPHLKWLNKLFFLKNFYTAFGVDDIVSKKNANAFIGGGMRFNDNDLKYVLSALPISIFAAQRY